MGRWFPELRPERKQWYDHIDAGCRLGLATFEPQPTARVEATASLGKLPVFGSMLSSRACVSCPSGDGKEFCGHG